MKIAIASIKIVINVIVALMVSWLTKPTVIVCLLFSVQ